MVTDTGEVNRNPIGDGVTIGKIFRKKGSNPKSPSGMRQNARSSEELISNFWGSYVHVADGPTGVVILRDPSGGLPCYQVAGTGFAAFASDAPLLVSAGLLRPSVDLEVVGQTLYFSQLPRVETAIAGIKQLLPGHMLTWDGQREEISQHWNPWSHVETDFSKSTAERSDRLGQILRDTHATWAACYPHSLVGLSGGLDSSIVAVCLAEASQRLECLTAVTSDPVGDERLYARLVCEQIGAQLFECEYVSDAIDLDRSVAEAVPIPNGKSHERAYNRAVRDAAHRLNVDAFFVGAGGDNVFYLTHSARPIVDRYRTEGLSKGLIDTISDICTITGASIWRVLREAIRVGSRGSRGATGWHADVDYLDPDFLADKAARPVEHPWLNAPAEAPLGKVGHISMILRAMNHIEHRDKELAVPMISPLLSQPVIEACLGIPSWEACEGGVDRSAARRAFSGALPPRVVGRHGKGSPDGFVGDFIHRHRAGIADRLLNGQLAANRLIDRKALEAALRDGAPLQRNDCARIMELVDTEAWIAHWSSPSLLPA
ncbi:asparagine synthase-related protein [Sphingopyxis sp. GW247-27LB]|uniref:asparagine synthase-related protein n=1 Tax=Sphingopyxis sp. GW247-27LB TaxID=2012632 RepID=UPI0015954160|nr:asparagine synthase-related protein [Sphingopyxis sp. GW247-27LB]